MYLPGIFCGGYHYSLKMYTYERVRSRNFARTWGFVQCSQAVPIAIGVPLSGKQALLTHSSEFERPIFNGPFILLRNVFLDQDGVCIHTLISAYQLPS